MRTSKTDANSVSVCLSRSLQVLVFVSIFHQPFYLPIFVSVCLLACSNSSSIVRQFFYLLPSLSLLFVHHPVSLSISRLTWFSSLLSYSLPALPNISLSISQSFSFSAHTPFSTTLVIISTHCHQWKDWGNSSWANVTTVTRIQCGRTKTTPYKMHSFVGMLFQVTAPEVAELTHGSADPSEKHSRAHTHMYTYLSPSITNYLGHRSSPLLLSVSVQVIWNRLSRVVLLLFHSNCVCSALCGIRSTGSTRWTRSSSLRVAWGSTTIRLRHFVYRHFVYRHFVYRHFVYYCIPA